jgi:hypothetical protein
MTPWRVDSAEAEFRAVAEPMLAPHFAMVMRWCDSAADFVILITYGELECLTRSDQSGNARISPLNMPFINLCTTGF